MRENWLSAYDFATTRASLFLGEYARADNPFAEVGRRTVSIQVTSVVRASDTSFQVKWSEQEYERGSLRSEEHTSELQSLMRISYAVFCLTKKKSRIRQPYPDYNQKY